MLTYWLTTAARIILGLIFLLGAVDGFALIFTGANLIHPPTSAEGLAFEAALKATGFIWPVMKAIELVAAICLLSNRAPALGVALLLPLIVVIVLFHFVLNPQGIPIAIVLLVCTAILMRAYATHFRGLLAPGLQRGAAKQ